MAEYTDDEQRALGDAQQATVELRQTEAAFATLRAEMLETIAKSNLGEAVLREKLYMGVNMLDRIRDTLVAIATSGVVVEDAAMIRELMAERA